jgi:aspartate/methionine/tyrosine aminotransferase
MLLREYAADYFDDENRSTYRPDPRGTIETRRAIAGYYARSGIAVDADQIVVTASASEAYGHLFATCRRPRGHVLLPRPSYPLFEEIAARHRLDCRYYDQHPERAWAFATDEIAAVADGDTVAIAVVSPNNPTGRIASERDVRELGALCRDRGCILIHDEVFSAFRYDRHAGGPLPRAVSVCPATEVATINGASKLLSAPDLKVSWTVLSGPEWQKRSERIEVENDLYLSASPLNQYLLGRMLEDHGEHTRRVVEMVAERRIAAMTAVAAIPGVHMVGPAGGIHAVLVLGRPESGTEVEMDDEELAVALLNEERVATHPGYLYGIRDYCALVVSLLPPPDLQVEAYERIAGFLERRGIG